MSFPPSTEDNARALAASKGYRIEKRGRQLVAVDPETGQGAAKARDWSALIRALMQATRASKGPGAA